jgi:ethanolamine utilization protein EutP (predicted NTPase)
LLDKPEIILLTKTDLADEKQIKKNIKILEKKNKKILAASIYDPASLEGLKSALKELLN